MIRFINISILVLFVLPQISNSIVWANYEINKKAITEEFCVNKEKPELNCEGQCHLADQLTEPVSQESNNPIEISYLPQLPLFFQDVDKLQVGVAWSSAELHENFHFYSFSPIFKIEHPPCV